MKHKKKAYYLDNGIIIPGIKDKYGFHPDKNIPCGFSLQIIYPKDIGTVLFYDLQKLNDYLTKHNITAKPTWYICDDNGNIK